MEAGQRFCTNCGAVTGADANRPTVAAVQTPPTVFPPAQPNTPDSTQLTSPTSTVLDTEPSASPQQHLSESNPYQAAIPAVPPPPPGVPAYNPYEISAPGGSQAYAQNASTAPSYPLAPAKDGAYPPVPVYAQKPKRSRGCIISSVILLLVLAAGIGGVFLLKQHFITTGNTGQNDTPTGGTTPVSTTANSGSTSTPNNGNTPTANGGSSEQLNLKVTYAGVNITILSTQVASSFPDDTSSPGAAGVARVNLQENNPTSHNPEYLESDALLLVLPGGSTVQTSNQKSGMSISPDASVNRQNWVDFPLSTRVALNQLTLRFGTATENQMSLPLQPGANVSTYQDKTINPNANFTYARLNWTLKTATKSYSYNSKQATTGNLYVVITLAVVNNSATDLTADPTSYMRLQAGSTTQGPDYTYTFPTSVVAQATGSGIVAFLMPQDATSFTLIMLGENSTNPPAIQATQTFQIQ